MTDIGFAKHVKYNGVVKFEVIKVSNKEDGQPKGQLISKCPFGVIVSTKLPTKKFDNFCPRNLKVVKSTK